MTVVTQMKPYSIELANQLIDISYRGLEISKPMELKVPEYHQPKPMLIFSLLIRSHMILTHVIATP